MVWDLSPLSYLWGAIWHQFVFVIHRTQHILSKSPLHELKCHTLINSVLFFVRTQVQYRKSVKNITFSSTNHDLFLKKNIVSNKEHFWSQKKNIFSIITELDLNFCFKSAGETRPLPNLQIRWFNARQIKYHNIRYYETSNQSD
jgi:hypothetical protein